jgi:hypothetical protein
VKTAAIAQGTGQEIQTGGQTQVIRPSHFPVFFPREVYSEYCLIPQKLLQAMIRNPRAKRILSISLLILGGMLMFFAPENIWIGAILFTLGVGVEIVGLVLAHRK